MQIFSFSCQGESHVKKGNLPCQDCSNALKGEEQDAPYWLAVVSDGHGGDRYIRSEVGSRMAVNLAERRVAKFAKDVDHSLFADATFTQLGADDDPEYKPEEPETEQGKAVRKIAEDVISRWYRDIAEYSKTNPLTDDEKKRITETLKHPEWIAAFEKGEHLEKNYGCTLMLCAVFEDFWLAIHVGDGKLYSLHANGQKVICEPVPWDSRCYQNVTTSFCNSRPSQCIRYCYGGRDTLPMAVFLGSDSMDDAYGDRLPAQYVNIAKVIAQKEFGEVEKDLKETLPIIATRGNKDDTSVALIANAEELRRNVGLLVNFQIADVEAQIATSETELRKKRDFFADNRKRNEEGIAKNREERAKLEDQKQKLEQERIRYADLIKAKETEVQQRSQFKGTVHSAVSAFWEQLKKLVSDFMERLKSLHQGHVAQAETDLRKLQEADRQAQSDLDAGAARGKKLDADTKFKTEQIELDDASLLKAEAAAEAECAKLQQKIEDLKAELNPTPPTENIETETTHDVNADETPVPTDCANEEQKE